MTAGGTETPETPDDFSGLLFPILEFRTFAQIFQCLGILVPFLSVDNYTWIGWKSRVSIDRTGQPEIGREGARPS